MKGKVPSRGGGGLELGEVALYANRGETQVARLAGAPDFFVTPLAAHGGEKLEQLRLKAKLTVGLQRSTGQGRTVDAGHCVLEACLHGLVLECSREAKRRGYHENSRPVPAGLSEPVTVILVEKRFDEGCIECRHAAAGPADSRAYRFKWVDGRGVSYWRSPVKRLGEALTYAL